MHNKRFSLIIICLYYLWGKTCEWGGFVSERVSSFLLHVQLLHHDFSEDINFYIPIDILTGVAVPNPVFLGHPDPDQDPGKNWI